MNTGAGFDANIGPPSENASSKKHRFPNLRGSFTIFVMFDLFKICRVYKL